MGDIIIIYWFVCRFCKCRKGVRRGRGYHQGGEILGLLYRHVAFFGVEEQRGPSCIFFHIWGRSILIRLKTLRGKNGAPGERVKRFCCG